MIRPGWLRRHAGLVALLAAYLLLGLWYSIANPLFEAPDEIWHFEYARWIAAGEGLAAPEDIGLAPWAQEGSQPPLYYLIAAGLIAPIDQANAPEVIRYNPHAALGQGDSFGNRNQMVHDSAQAWPWRGVALAAHLTRLLSLLLGACTIVCTYSIAARLLPWLPAASVLAAALLALNPQFLLIHSSTTNDALVTAVAAGTLLLLIALLCREGPPARAQLVLLGILLGLAALSKLSGLLLVAPWLLVVAYSAWRKRSWRELVRGLLIPAAIALALSAWWYWRNYRLFGDALALDVMFAVLPGRGEPASPAQLLALAPGVWRSLWGVFGWFNVPAGEWLYLLYTFVVAFGCGAAAIAWIRGRRPPGATLILLLGWIGLLMLSLVRWAQISYPQGRLLFPALPALAFFVGWGWAALFQGLQIPKSGPAVLCAALLIPALLAPVLWITPAYAPPPSPPPGSLPSRPAGAFFDDQIELVGADIEQASVRAGESVDLTLYWRATQKPRSDLSVFVHATDSSGILQAQRDSYPGMGNRPTSTWESGVVYADPHRITLPATILTTDTVTLTVGLYDFATGERLLDASAADSAQLGIVEVQPSAQRSRVEFGGMLAMTDWSLDRTTLAPGQTLAAQITLEALRPPHRDYVLFTHLVRPPGEVWAQEDDQPDPSTATWQAGETAIVTHEMRLPEDAPPGDYQVEVGIYDAETLERLAVDFSDAGVVIGRARVEAGPGPPAE